MTEPSAQGAAPTQDVRPVVARAPGNRSMWIFAAILIAAGSGMFYALQMRRAGLENPSLVTQQSGSDGMISSPSELVIPPAPNLDTYEYGSFPQPRTGPLGAGQSYGAPLAADGYVRSQPQSYSSRPIFAPPVAETVKQPPSSGPAFAYQAPAVSPSPSSDSAEKTESKRVEAGQLRNPSTTVPQGSVIQAVMETALDSTRGGFARAIVSRDVMSFDGTRVLIPKGSKLFGNYEADVSLGQNRALIQWRRLTRPDGAIIDLDSPSADPLGRAGVKGKVNTHFFQRFGGAILQSLLDIGVRSATREAAGDTVVLALPGTATQVGSTNLQNTTDIRPTLKVRQGASVSVFVARDLDFTTVGG